MVVRSRSRARRCCPASSRPPAFSPPWPLPTVLALITGQLPGCRAGRDRAVLSQPALARKLRWAQAQERLPALLTAAGWLELFGQPDSADPRFRELAAYLAGVQQDTLAHGDQGWWDDNVAFLTPWGFDPAAIRVPVQLWHGEADTAVPPSFGTGWPAGSRAWRRISLKTTTTAASTTLTWPRLTAG